MKRQRFVVDGIWSGYTLVQRHLVHRQVIVNPHKLAWIKRHPRIEYSDQTFLELTIRPAKHYERVKQIHAYDSLIDDCYRHDVQRVDDLPSRT